MLLGIHAEATLGIRNPSSAERSAMSLSGTGSTAADANDCLGVTKVGSPFLPAPTGACVIPWSVRCLTDEPSCVLRHKKVSSNINIEDYPEVIDGIVDCLLYAGAMNESAHWLTSPVRLRRSLR